MLISFSFGRNFGKCLENHSKVGLKGFNKELCSDESYKHLKGSSLNLGLS